MRLNSRREICEYLGYHGKNQVAWRRIVQRYGHLIYRDPDQGRYWALTEELDAQERSRCQVVFQKTPVGAKK